VLVIEHNLEVVQGRRLRNRFGPRGWCQRRLARRGGPTGAGGQVTGSHTGAFLRERLAARTRSAPASRVADHRAIITHPGISIVGARHHNLKNLSIELPREQMIVITGLSGSGKSSLAFDILFAEGQRRFLDSMSTYARQFVEQMERPDVDHVEGLPPSVAIEQRLSVREDGKSTVATVTEVYHFFRLLFAKLGTQYCPKCDVAVTKQSQSAITKQVKERLEQGPVSLLAPVVKARKGFHKEVATWAAREGYTHLFVDQQRYAIADFPKLERFREHSIEVVIADLRKTDAPQIAEWVKDALRVGKRICFPGDKEGCAHRSEQRNDLSVLWSRVRGIGPPTLLFQFATRLVRPLPWIRLYFAIFRRRLASRISIGSRAQCRAAQRLDRRSRKAAVSHLPKDHALTKFARAVRVRRPNVGTAIWLLVTQALDKLARLNSPGKKRRLPIRFDRNQAAALFMQRVGLEYLHSVEQPPR